MEHPNAQIKAIRRMRLFMQLTRIQHLASQQAARLGLFAYSLVCVVRWWWRQSSSGMCCGLCLKVITSPVFSNHTGSSFRQQTHDAPYKSDWAVRPPALSAVGKTALGCGFRRHHQPASWADRSQWEGAGAGSRVSVGPQNSVPYEM